MNEKVGMSITIVAYLCMMITIGIRVSKRNRTVDDFYLGGRKLGAFVTAMSAEASDMSSYLLMGLPGLAYLTGLADVGWTAIGLAIGTYLNWLFVAKRLRRYSEVVHAITIPSFFSNRYHDSKRILSFVAAMIIIIFFVPYTASGFAACGKLFNSLFGMDYHVAMIASAIIIIIYTMLGGFLAASMTDLIQGIIMTLALFMMLFFSLQLVGGGREAFAILDQIPGYFSLSQTYDVASNTAQPYTFLTIISTLAWGLGYFGMPHILLRFMAIEHEEKVVTSRRIATVWVVISMGISILIGIVGLAITKEGLIPFLEGSQSETIIVVLSNILAKNGFLFSLFTGLVIAGILASTMSTSDSQLLAASSSVSNDLIKDVFHKEYSNKQLLYISRITLFIIAIIAIGLAWNSNSSIFKIVSFAWAGFGASFGPVVILALYWKRSNLYGALAGMVSGGLMIFIYKFLIRPLGGVFDIYELLPAFLFALCINIVVSLCTKKPDEAIEQDWEKVNID